ncbi:MAG: EmrB/QacA subfamily drug resistance transporter [Clostridium sp.]|jgi:EmrB/QacA subfamily drug resistance transporter
MEETKYSGSEKWLALAVVVIGTFMSVLNTSIVNIAVPKMMSVFGVSLDSIKWVLTGYTIALGTVIPLTAYLMENLGNKRIYVFALSVFTLGSLLCGFAWSNTSMIIFRVIQAIGGGMIMPVGMALIYQVFPLEERGMALGFWGIAAMAAPALGPTLGGYIIEKMGWRLIFSINVPIGIVGIILSMIILNTTPIKKFKPFDYLGCIYCTIGIVSILYILGVGSSINWNEIKYPILLTIGLVNLLLFVLNELKHPYPLLDLRILKNYNFTMSTIIISILMMALIGISYVIPLFLQNVRGYTAMQTGIIMFPAAIITGLTMPISGYFGDKIPAKLIVIPGLLVLFISSYKLGFINMDVTTGFISLMLIFRGVGLGCSMMVVNNIGMNAVEQSEISNASSLQNTIRQIASSLSITIITTMLQSKSNFIYARYTEQINMLNGAALGTIRQYQGIYMKMGQSAAEAKSSAVYAIASALYKQAYIKAIQYTILSTTIAVLVAVVLALFMKTKPIVKDNKDVNLEVANATIE